ncbi:helix-turn-helix domain-containing protein [Wolbachia endosymbiont of Folsomia candida]|uniref:helix-turn-helix domain-containing protein n=1 Tax=Wolbachia endosymbiont of Folsomia candida TaxID=169402 RepID=UPI000B044F8D|nr:XRE family transcriptional regulator [Wolbachia endosymbiont of Folsomia candida]APR99034.1 XRE family transcriptional regulator [Wolbachia endosymbiont of Folsomia candida]
MEKTIIANGNNVKTEMLSIVRNIIKANGWTQKKAADVLKIDQPKVSAIVNLKTKGFSLDRIFMFLSLLGYEVEITVKKANELHVVG